MTYAEAVKRAEWWHKRYSEGIAALGGEPFPVDTEAIAVLRRAEPVIAAVEGAALVEDDGSWRLLADEVDWDGPILRAALAYREAVDDPDMKPYYDFSKGKRGALVKKEKP